MSSTSLRIVITNGVISNTGDAAILAGIRSALTDCGATDTSSITVLDSNARKTRRRYPDWNVVQQMTVAPPRHMMKFSRGVSLLRRWFVARIVKNGRLSLALLRAWPFSFFGASQALAAIQDADVVVSTGGTYLVDHYDFRFRAIELELARRFNKPVWLWTQSVGPFESERSRASARRISDVATSAYFRDEVSKRSWLDIGGNASRSHVAADAAFALPLARSWPSSDGPVLISVRDWQRSGATGEPFSFTSYRSSMRAVAGYCVAQEVPVRAISTCQGLPGYVDDSSVAHDFFDDLGEVEIDGEFHTPEELTTQLSTARAVVTTRMHLAILALSVGIPTVAIAYEFKTVELFQSLGLGQFVFPIEEMDSEKIIEKVRVLLTHPDAARLKDDALETVRDSARLPARALLELVKVRDES